MAVVHAACRAFLDEAGTHPETPVLSVAGFYGEKEQWDIYRSSWEPHSTGFHAKRSEHLFPQLFAAITASKINGMLITIGKKKYQEYANAHLKTALGNPYSICAFLCVSTICAQVKGKPTAFVLEEGQPNLEFVKKMLEAFMNTGEICIAAVRVQKSQNL